MNQIGAVMDKFEASFDEVDVRSQYVENAINSSTASTMPEDAVESLLQQVSDEHGLQFASRAADASTAPVAMSAPTAALPAPPSYPPGPPRRRQTLAPKCKCILHCIDLLTMLIH